MASSTEFFSPLCRLSYGSGLFEPSQINGQGASKYRATLIFPKTDLRILEPYVREALIAEWKDRGLEMAKSGLIRSPFLMGDAKEARNKQTGEISPGLGADKFFIRVTAELKNPPAVVWKSKNIQETEKTVYSGCYGKAVLIAYTWDNATGGKGVTFGIAGFQKHAEGDRLGAGYVDPTKYFETIEDQGDAPEETREGAGAAGLFGG